MEFYKNIKDDENHRFKSWEHCFDFFKSVPTDIDLACLHLGFYLASWGMYRGSSFLLQKDYKIHKTAVCEVLKSEYDVLRGIELQCFNDEKIDILFGLIGRLNTIYQNIKKSVETKNNDRDTTDTLITKILLGTLGCIPAYDRFFINGRNLCTTPQIIAEQRTISNYPISFFIIRNKKAVCCLIYPWNSQNQGEITLKSTFQADLGCDCCSTNLAVFRLWIK